MASHEVERVLANWMAEANSPSGQLPEGTDPARWVAQRFLAWWQPQVADELSSAEAAVAGVQSELNRLGGWTNPQLGGALHGLIHAGDALASLRNLLGIGEELDGPR